MSSQVILLFLLASCLAHSAIRKVEVLDEDNWELMLSGEWMIEFYAPWCPACRALESVWDDFASWSDDLGITVGKIDVTNSPGLSGRFMVTALPTIYHVKDGLFRQYRGSRDRDEFINFVEERKWADVEPISSWKSPDSLQMSVVSGFFKLSMLLRNVHTHITEDHGIPYWGSYLLFALATIVIGAVLGLILVFIIDCFYPAKPAACSHGKPVITPEEKEKLDPVDYDEDIVDEDDEVVEEIDDGDKDEEDEEVEDEAMAVEEKLVESSAWKLDTGKEISANTEETNSRAIEADEEMEKVEGVQEKIVEAEAEAVADEAEAVAEEVEAVAEEVEVVAEEVGAVAEEVKAVVEEAEAVAKEVEPVAEEDEPVAEEAIENAGETALETKGVKVEVEEVSKVEEAAEVAVAEPVQPSIEGTNPESGVDNEADAQHHISVEPVVGGAAEVRRRRSRRAD